MKLRIPRIPIVSTLAFLLFVTVLVLWIRSPHHADGLLFYTPAGHMNGLASDHGGIVFCVSDVPAGEEMGLSADAMSASADEFATIHETLFGSGNERWHFLGFHVAAGVVDPKWTWKFNAVLVPYWALVIPLAILPLAAFRRLILRIRRKRRGQCLACGYDLRQSPERCPECGRPVGGQQLKAGDPTVPSDAPSAARVALSWFVVGAILMIGATAVLRGRRAAAATATRPPEVALLGRTVQQFDVHGATLDEAIAALGKSAQSRVAMDGLPLNAPGRAIHVRVALRDVRLQDALRTLCGPAIGDNPDQFQVWAAGPVVHAGQPSQAPRLVRAYPVDSLLRQIQIELDREVKESPDSRQASQSGSSGNQFYKSPSTPPATPAGQALANLMLDMVCTGDWTDNGGTLGTLAVVAGRLWVCQTQEGHAQVRTMLAMLEAPANPTDVAAIEPVPNPHANLEQKIPELNLDSTTLGAAIETLRQATHANIAVYWNQLAAMGLLRDTPIKLHLWAVTLDQALGAILTVAGGEHPGMRAVRDGIIVVGTPDQIRNGSLSTRIYEIRDLIEKYRTEGGLLRPTAATSQRAVNDWGQAPPGTFQDTLDSIAKLIEDTVDTDSWKDNGGSIGALRELAGRLVITQTPAAHRKIVALLRTLREGGSKEGTELKDTGR
jgi:hypothetical protein